MTESAGVQDVLAPPPKSAPAPPLDEATRRARLVTMRRRATGLLVLAAAVFLVARLLQPAHPWLGFVRATAEASLVGGLADWFAVTTLFRRPLGLPIPHTASVSSPRRSSSSFGHTVTRERSARRSPPASRRHRSCDPARAVRVEVYQNGRGGIGLVATAVRGSQL